MEVTRRRLDSMKTETLKAARVWWWSRNLCDRARGCRARGDELDQEEAKGERLGGEKVGGWWWW